MLPGRKRILGILAVAVVFLVLLSAVTVAAEESEWIGKKAPDFTLKGLDGKTYTLAEICKGKGVFLNFWGVRCGPCVQEIPLLNRLAKQYAPKGMVLLGINIDAIGGDILTPVMKDLNIVIDYPVLVDPEMTTMDPYKIEGAPLSVFIDSTGTIRYHHLGYAPGDEKKYEEAISKILPASQGNP